MLDGEIDQQLENAQRAEVLRQAHCTQEAVGRGSPKREAYRYWNYAVSVILSPSQGYSFWQKQKMHGRTMEICHFQTNSEECEKEGNALVDEMKVLEEEIKACEEEMEKLQEQLATEIEAEKVRLKIAAFLLKWSCKNSE